MLNQRFLRLRSTLRASQSLIGRPHLSSELDWLRQSQLRLGRGRGLLLLLLLLLGGGLLVMVLELRGL